MNNSPNYEKIVDEEMLKELNNKKERLFNEYIFGGKCLLPLNQVFRKKFDTMLFLPYNFNFLQPIWWDEKINTLEEQEECFNKFKLFLLALNEDFYVLPSLNNSIKLAIHFQNLTLSFEEYCKALSIKDTDGFMIDSSPEVLFFSKNETWAMVSDVHSELVFVGLESSILNNFITSFAGEYMEANQVIYFLGERRGGEISKTSKNTILQMYGNFSLD